MISARRFYRSPSLWLDLVPTLEHVVRWLNQNTVRSSWPVPARGGNYEHNAFLAEAAFALHAAGVDLDSPLRSAVLDGVIAQLHAMGHETPEVENLEEQELVEIRDIAINLHVLTRDLKAPEYWPLAEGCGYVDPAHADIIDGGALYEVKTVSRAFRAPDLRQLLTYAAMFDAAGTRIGRIGLMNPRRGTQVAVSIDFLARGSSGLASAELLRRIVARMRDIAFDDHGE